jgi:ElaB/YqjD/DUF883 family membrane-anchored ribosome-binding protein
MLERTGAATAALAAELRNVIRQTETLLAALSADRDEALVQVRDRVAGAMTTARERLAALEQRAGTLRRDATAAADVRIRENPWRSVGVAAAIGFVLGAVLAPANGANEGE